MRLARVSAISEGGVSACLFNLTAPTLGHALHEMDKWIYTCTVDPHLIILDSWICKLAKIYWHPQNQHLWHFATICEHVQSGEKNDLLPDVHITGWGQKRWHSAFLFQFPHCKPVPFVWPISRMFSHFGAFCRWFWCFKWPSSVMLKCCLISARRCCVPFGENTSVWWDSFRREVTVLLALSSGLVNQQYILSNGSLNKNKHKTK